jgi:hypothetical protein
MGQTLGEAHSRIWGIVSCLENSLNKSGLWAGSPGRLLKKNVSPAEAGSKTY